MPSAPQTWTALQALQYRIYNEVQVGGVSPFTAFGLTGNPTNPNGASDAQRFGANPFGQVNTAIFIGVPKDWSAKYPRQCHIIPPSHVKSYMRALGGKTWHENTAIVRFLFQRTADWYQTMQDMVAAADATYASMAKHAELVNAPTVAAARLDQLGQLPAYHYDEAIGVDWDCWAFGFWMRQEFAPLGGVNP